MIVYVELECILYEGSSLKEKRSILKRLMHRLQKDFNVSVAELDYQNLWQRIKLGIAVVTNDYVQGEKVIQRCLEVIDSFPELERTLTNIEGL